MGPRFVQRSVVGALLIAGGLLLASASQKPARAEAAERVRVLAPVDRAGSQLAQANPCNPCAERNPCAANPCAGRNPCAANPCAGRNPCGANPCAGANPCGGANPCAGAAIDPARFQQPKGVALASGDRATLVAEGERLWNDPSIGKSGLSCGNCHVQGYAMMKPGFADPYPHYVEMADQRAGVKAVNAAEMVNFCMLVPMAAEPLPWTSRELAALTAYVEHLQPGYRPVGASGANPCNPCAGANPCAGRNPCGGR